MTFKKVTFYYKIPILWCLGASLLLFSCCSPISLGDGTFKGILPDRWHDSVPREEGVLLRITNEWVPVPCEMIIKISVEGSKVSKEGEWVKIKEETRPGPKVPTGDEWLQTTRKVRVYRKDFGSSRLFDAFVDIRFDQNKAERFLDRLSLKETGDAH